MESTCSRGCASGHVVKSIEEVFEIIKGDIPLFWSIPF